MEVCGYWGGEVCGRGGVVGERRRGMNGVLLLDTGACTSRVMKMVLQKGRKCKRD